MARTALTAVTPVSSPIAPVTALALDLTFTAADVSNGNSAPSTGRELVLVWNTHATTGYTATIGSVADDLGRTGDVTSYAIAAGVISAFLLPQRGWKQADGKIYLNANNAAVKFCVLQLPAIS